MAKQKSGLYRTKVVIGHDRDGKPVTKYISGKTKKELEENRQEILRHYATGTQEAQREVLFSTYLSEWYELFKKPLISESSRQHYYGIIHNQIIPAFSNRQLRSITSADLQRYMNGLDGMGKTTIGYHGSILKNIFEHAYANGIIDRNPAVGLKKPSAEKESKRSLTDAETAAALKVGNEHPEGLLLLVLYYTGLRRGEALGLKWSDVDFREKTISVRRDVDFATASLGELKTKNSRRKVPIPSDLEASLRSFRSLPEMFVFPASRGGEFLSQSTFIHRWDRLMQAMAAADPSIETVDGKSILTPHYFRHNYASVLYNAGVDILAAQRFLGHADIKTTLSIYSHLSDGKTEENAQKVRDAFERTSSKLSV